MVGENSFGAILETMRQKREKEWSKEQWSVKAVAQRLNVSRTQYYHWRDGDDLPRIEKYKYILAIFRPTDEERAALSGAYAQFPLDVKKLPQPNTIFTGRTDYLTDLQQKLHRTGSVLLTQAVGITGTGGVGKTQIALAYAYRNYPKPYRAVFWANASDRATLQADYDDIARRLELPEHDDQDADRRVEAVKRWLDGHTRWLLILDNADDLQLVRSFMPEKPLGHIVLTTRSQAIRESNIAVQLDVDVMKPQEAVVYLLRRAGKWDEMGTADDAAKLAAVHDSIRTAASDIVAMLGYLPLAIEHAGAYIERSGSIADYIAIYQEKRRFFLDRHGQPGPYDHPESVAVTFDLCFQKARELQPLAEDILSFCAFLQPDAMPEELFYQDGELKLTVTTFNNTMAALRLYSLVKRDEEERSLSIHSLVQAVVVDGMTTEARKKWQVCVVQALKTAFPAVEVKEWKKCSRLLPHALVCKSWDKHELPQTVEVAELFHKTSNYLLEIGYPNYEVQSLLARALAIRKRHLGYDHRTTATTLELIGTFHRQKGNYQKAELLYQKVLAVRERVLEPDHIEIAQVLNYLGVIYMHQAKNKQAERLLIRSLAIRERRLGIDHPDTTQTLTNLASCYRRQGKFEESRQKYERAVEVKERTLGEDHPETAQSRAGLAVLLMQQREYERAETLLTQVLQAQENILGFNHYETAQNTYNLASCYMFQGKYEQARPLMARAVALHEENLGEHPNTTYCLNGLAILHTHFGEYGQAEALHNRALAIREKTTGSDHPEAARSFYGLGRLSHLQGNYGRAEQLYRQALDIQLPELGPQHPQTEETQRALNELLRNLERRSD